MGRDNEGLYFRSRTVNVFGLAGKANEANETKNRMISFSGRLFFEKCKAERGQVFSLVKNIFHVKVGIFPILAVKAFKRLLLLKAFN
ncbi:MAG: hypothetical protein Q7J07_07750 [Pelolinea sp.]|nr:hypothetical protein [Pelolinea sp.]